MIAPRGTSLAELDRHASTATEPYAIITADCSRPKEIDDGLFVEPLPSASEMYRVGVCVVDASSLYENGDIFRQAMTNIEARYWQLPGNEEGYDPMIDPEAIHELEFTEGSVRDALIVSFLVGKNQPPSEVTASFGKVEVTKNLPYSKFSRLTESDKADRRYSRAAAFILHHLRYHSDGDTDGGQRYDTSSDFRFQGMISGSHHVWWRGARINEAYMIAAGHLVGALMAEEDRPAIYRVHDPRDERYIEFLPPNIATYSRMPGPHAGLNLSPFSRVTSPLRRLEDFMMSYQLKQRHLGRDPTLKDIKDIAIAVQRLNGHIVRQVSEGPLRMHKNDSLGRGFVEPANLSRRRSNIIPLQRQEAETEAAS